MSYSLGSNSLSKIINKHHRRILNITKQLKHFKHYEINPRILKLKFKNSSILSIYSSIVYYHKNLLFNFYLKLN